MCTRVALVIAGLFPALCIEQSKADEESLRKQRLQLMERVIADFEVGSTQGLSKDELAFSPKPLLRYSDPTRGVEGANVLLDASVWRLGKAGRPKALITLEIYRSSSDAGVLAYEFLSLTNAKYQLVRKAEPSVAWDATGSALQLRDFPDAPKPAPTAFARLAQMRVLARRFQVHETLHGEPIPCRLLSQPIDRYASEESEILDGAIFAFANGTNPETGLVLECDAGKWRYGIFRLSSAEARIELDGKMVASYPFFGEYGRRDGSYTSNTHPVQLLKQSE